MSRDRTQTSARLRYDAGMRDSATDSARRRPSRPRCWRVLIELETPIQAPLIACFDLARSVDAHLASAAASGERAIAGRVEGLARLGDGITWRARHFGVWQTLSVEIVELQAPVFFVDEMLAGAFRYLRHEHRFIPRGDGSTLMQDRFCFAAPLGLLGYGVSRLVLAPYLRHFLQQRNAWLKQSLENQL